MSVKSGGMKAEPSSFNLPPVIMAYWSAANAARIGEAAVCFAADAVVLDESRVHQGPAAIRGWIEETTRQYQPIVEALGVEEKDGCHLVTARVSGTFPGSPIELPLPLPCGTVKSFDWRSHEFGSSDMFSRLNPRIRNVAWSGERLRVQSQLDASQQIRRHKPTTNGRPPTSQFLPARFSRARGTRRVPRKPRP